MKTWSVEVNGRTVTVESDRPKDSAQANVQVLTARLGDRSLSKRLTHASITPDTKTEIEAHARALARQLVNLVEADSFLDEFHRS